MHPSLDTTPPPIGYIDGSLPRQVGPVHTEYPFLNDKVQTPDSYPRLHVRKYKDHRSSYQSRLAERTSVTNLCTHSTVFSNAVWTKGNLTQNSVTNLCPDGRLVAYQYTPSTSDGYLERAFTPASVAAHTHSVWLRCLTGTVSLSLHCVRASDNAFAGVAPLTITTTWKRYTHVFAPIDTSSHKIVIGGFSTWGTSETVQLAYDQLENQLFGGTPGAETVATVNLLNFPTTFSDGRWTKGTLTQVSSTATDPSGGATAFEYSPTSGDNYLQQSFTPAALIPHTFSVWLRSVSGTVTLTLHASRVSDSSIVASVAITLTTTWQLFTLPFTPADLTSHNVVLGGYVTWTTGAIRVTLAALTVASVPGAYVETLATTRTALVPDLDPDDPFAYLVSESIPQAAAIGDLVRFDRIFARIPAQQITRDYQSFNRPDISGLKSGSTYAATLDKGSTAHLWTARKDVLGYQNNQGGTTANALPSGTVTITLSPSGTTASFAANASQSTIQAAVAGLVGGSKLSYITVVKSADGSAVTLWYGKLVGGDIVGSVTLPAGVLNTGVGNSIQLVSTGSVVTPDTKLLHVPSHNTTVGALCAVWNGDTLVATGSVASVSGGDYLNLVLSDLESPDINITHVAFAAAAAVRYAQGAREINIRTTRDFYLPGVSMLSDGTTLADLDSLPGVTTSTSPQRWLDRIVAGDTYTAINASQIGQYAGPIAFRDTVYAKKDATCMESVALT